MAHHVLADIALIHGNAGEARRHYVAALDTGAGDHPSRGAVLRRSLGEAAALEGDVDAQESLYRQALSELETVGDNFEIARTSVALGWLLARRSPDEAVDVLRTAWRIADAEAFSGVAVASVAGLAIVRAQQQRPELAARMFAAAEGYAASRGLSVPRALGDYIGLSAQYHDAIADCRDRLGSDAYAAAWDQGGREEPSLDAEEWYAPTRAVTT
jgi:tetratricopeptide (TPR) repeat protein